MAATPPLKLLLTDLHPNVKPEHESAPHVSSHPESVDALNLPPKLASAQILSLTGSLHHFTHDQVRQFLESAVSCGSSLFVLDGVASLKSVLLMPLRSFCWAIVAGTWYGVARCDLRQIVLTFTGVLPMCMAYDALISALRFYSRNEIEEIIQQVSGHNDYVWDLSRWGSLPECSIMLAYPKKTPSVVDQ